MKPVLGAGPNPASLALVGEAPGTNETLYGRPFVGEAGQELDRMLRDAGLSRSDAYVTNVFKHQPPGNDVLAYFVPGTDEAADKSFPALRPNKYLRRELADEVRDLARELNDVGATVVIGLGATALWALLGYQKITNYVGTVHPPTGRRPYTVVPTYHPAGVLRNWAWRTTVVANFLKAAECLGQGRQLASSSANPLSQFRIKVSPSIKEIEAWVEKTFDQPAVAVDVETAHGQIRTISFSHGPKEAFVIPFWEPPAPSTWSTPAAEAHVWGLVRKAFSNPRKTYIFHNGAYDIQYIWRVHGIPILGVIHDTMVAHWALEPELPKGLGQLAAVYLKLPEWKAAFKNRISEKEED